MLQVATTRQAEQLGLELEALKAEVQFVKLRVLPAEPDEPATPTPRQSAAPQVEDQKEDAPQPSAFAKLFRTAAKPGKQDEAALPNRLEVRRGSADSDATLVNEDPASTLLASLAPAISNLQALGKRISLLRPPSPSLLADFKSLCVELEELLERLQKKPEDGTVTVPTDGKIYDHDSEMRTLLLKALTRKVQIERERTVPPPVALVPSPTFASAKSNPFIVHSSALPVGKQKVTMSKPIGGPATGGGGSGLGGQSMWRANVFRIGSYQASALFSNSPVAVKRPM